MTASSVTATGGAVNTLCIFLHKPSVKCVMGSHRGWLRGFACLCCDAMGQRLPSLDEIGRLLTAHAPREVSLAAQPGLKQAAVAAVLREASPAVGAEVLMIRRAEHPRDPWSGHMALPGGRVDAADADAYAAALRETREEVGLALEVHGEPLGRLSDVEAIARGGRLPLVIVPYVFALRGVSGEGLEHDRREVQETLWVPLTFLLEAGNRQSMDWEYAGQRVTLPCYRYEGRVIWGLTLRMLDELLGLLR